MTNFLVPNFLSSEPNGQGLDDFTYCLSLVSTQSIKQRICDLLNTEHNQKMLPSLFSFLDSLVLLYFSILSKLHCTSLCCSSVSGVGGCRAKLGRIDCNLQ